MKPIKFGFQGGAVETMSSGGAYLLRLPGFLEAGVSHDTTFMVWGFYPTILFNREMTAAGSDPEPHVPTYPHRCYVDNMLQALGIIYDLIKTHGRYEFLPAEVMAELEKEKENPHEV